MMHFLTQYGPTVLIIAALVAFFAFLIAGLIRDKRKGKSSCCGGCSGCAMAGQCHGHCQTPQDASADPAEDTAEN